KALLLQVGLLCGVLAAARPQWGTRLETVTRRGIDVAIVLDTSLSMAATDLAPSRLESARHAIASLLERLTGDRVTLVTFAAQGSTACPLTVDHAAIRLFLEVATPELEAGQGTGLAAGLRAGLAALRPESEQAAQRSRVLVLFSDGEDHEGALEEVRDELRHAHLPVYAVGCGSTRGAPIPVEDPAGGQSYKKDREGKLVTTRLDESALEQLALDTGGHYYRATAGELEIEEIAKTLAQLDAGEGSSRMRAQYEERYQFPLALGFAALMAEMLIGDRIRGPRLGGSA
ncbi:MAG TPA: VWA domain-containing protein, partial [Candidatus Polarisedimenticolaceae bacterium]|nr:VWA domain-containing protein [Candidatus Polarisedimenticolaceae bacterium]